MGRDDDRPPVPALPADAALGEGARLSGAQFMPGADGLLCDALRWWAVAA